MSTKSKTKDKKQNKVVKKAPAISKESAFYSSILDKMDKKYNLSAGDYSPTYLSTNLLSIDYVIGGGIRPGMITVSGVEMSAKSTLALETLASSVINQGNNNHVSLIMYNDAENSLDANYSYNIAGRDIMSMAGSDSDISIPILYNSANVVEKLYDSMAFLMSRLPDKIYSKKYDGWFYRLDKGSKKHQDAISFLDKSAELDKTLSKGDSIFYRTANSAPQGLFIIDSYASYAPDGVVEDDEIDNSLGLMARLYSRHIPRINGYIKKKSLIVLGLNQIRQNPMARFEKPWYETGGNALKHYSNNRGILTPRVVPEFWRAPKDRDIQNEKSVEFDGAIDQYAFKHYKNIKNKYGTPFRETWSRIWVADGNKPLARGRGFDKVFDTYNVLELMNVAKIGNSGKLGKVIKFDKESPILAGITLSWTDFKALILFEIATPDFVTPYLEKNAREVASRLGLKRINLRRKVSEVVYSS